MSRYKGIHIYSYVYMYLLHWRWLSRYFRKVFFIVIFFCMNRRFVFGTLAEIVQMRVHSECFWLIYLPFTRIFVLLLQRKHLKQTMIWTLSKHTESKKRKLLFTHKRNNKKKINRSILSDIFDGTYIRKVLLPNYTTNI